jgi:hypothetical protein
MPETRRNLDIGGMGKTLGTRKTKAVGLANHENEEAR